MTGSPVHPEQVEQAPGKEEPEPLPAAGRGGRPPRWVRGLDGAVDGIVVAFGIWTLLYLAAMYGGVRASLTLLVWLPLAVLAVLVCAWREQRSVEGAEDADDPGPGPPAATAEPAPRARQLGWRSWGVAALVCGLGVAAASIPALQSRPWPLLPMLALMAAGAGVTLAHVAGSWRRFGEVRPPRHSEHVLALVGGAALASVIPFFRRVQGDDVYVVNRSVWTAEHDTFALRDTMFGPETFASTYGGGAPLTSFEGLLGAVARAIGMSGAEFVHLVAPSLICIPAVWASWRLVRAWAPRRHVLVLLVSVVFLLWASRGAVGDMAYLRLWTGKVVGFTLVMPLTWVYLTRLARPGARGLRWHLFMLFALGMAFAGLTGTATLLAPLVSAAVALAALVTRGAFARMIAGAAAFSIAPVLHGLATILLSSGGVGRREEWQADPFGVLVRALGRDDGLIAVMVLALVLAPLLVRSRGAAALGAAATMAFVVAVLPGVPKLVDALLGTGVIHFRLLLIPPIAVSVGLLAAIPLPRALPKTLERCAGVALAGALAVTLVLVGTAPWKAPKADVTASPEVKVWKDSYDDVQAVIALEPEGPVLLPQNHMRTLTTVSTRVFAVTPRGFDLLGLPASMNPDERGTLNEFSRLDKRPPKPAAFEEALEVIGVSLVCLPRQMTGSHRNEMLTRAGYQEQHRAGDLTCYARPGELR